MGLLKRAGDLWRLLRRRYGWLDHVARAAGRYGQVRADRMAAALAYYAFFAAFALTGVGFAVLGWVLRRDATVTLLVQDWVNANLPPLDVNKLADAATSIGAIALVGLVITGWRWVDGMRGAVRHVWLLDEKRGRFLVRVGLDLAVLAGLGVLLLASIGVAAGVPAAIRWSAGEAGLGDVGVVGFGISVLGFLVGLAVNTALAMALLTGLPRLRLPLRRLWRPALLIAAGLELLKTVGRLYFSSSMANPAYQAVASAVGLLLFLYLLNQVILFAAALTATRQQPRG
ncbi:MAG: YhjD/YihY/BrkB family envelope integrity protein [Micromonosporaceae bacterium]